MSQRLLHTPEGVRDIYGEEYARKLKLQELLHTKIKSFGFHDIQTPTFEFFDVFSKEIGTVPSKELYKFFDKEGNTLVLRPDFTPSMARCAANYFLDEDIAIRFCYVGNTFANTSNLQGKLKEVTEMGAELIGDASIEADAEMISLVVESLLSTGLKEFQVSIGQTDFFKGLCEAAGLSEETEENLRDFISIKNYFGAEKLLQDAAADEKDIAIILKVTDMFGSIESLIEAKSIVSNQRSLAAIEKLEKLYTLLTLYGVEQYVSFDLGMLSKYHYYTGIIFKGYTYGVGDAILKGGRYDNLLNQFGKESAAIGFMIVIDDLMAALSRQQLPLQIDNSDSLLLYRSESFEAALKRAKDIRRDGGNVELMCAKDGKTIAEYIEFAKNNMIGKIICYEADLSIKEVIVSHV